MANSNITQVIELRSILARIRRLSSGEGVVFEMERLLSLYPQYQSEVLKTPEIFALKPVVLGCVQDKKKEYVLIIPLYGVTHEGRAREFMECLKRNLKHKRITKIVIFYDRNGCADANDPFLHSIKGMNVTIIDKRGRLSYEEAFNYANANFPEQNIILANADIYFNDTLIKLDPVDMTGVFLCLTRWNVQLDGQLKIAYLENHSEKSYISQDVWIFKTPLKIDFKCDFKMGINHCDSFLNYHLMKASVLRVVNPCLDVQACHLHLSGHRSADLVEIARRNEEYEEEQARLGNFDEGLPWSHLVFDKRA